jgi:hypothetical protein
MSGRLLTCIVWLTRCPSTDKICFGDVVTDLGRKMQPTTLSSMTSDVLLTLANQALDPELQKNPELVRTLTTYASSLPFGVKRQTVVFMMIMFNNPKNTSADIMRKSIKRGMPWL